MSRRVTLQDVADRAGVSYATADRVVNQRGGVAQKSRVKVEAALHALDYVRDERAANLARGREYKFVFLLPNGPNAFYDALRRALNGRRGSLMAERVAVQIVEFTPFDAADLATQIEGLDLDTIDGLAVVASADGRVSDALRRVRCRGVPTVALIAETERDARDTYVGLDNKRAGALAGRLLAFAHREGTGRILPIIGTHDAPDHSARLSGCLATMTGLSPHVHILPAVISTDNPGEVERLVAAAIAPGSTITGIYNAGAGNRGLLRALEGRLQHRPAVVVHELSQTTRMGIETDVIDAVIDQKPDDEIAMALGHLRALADAKPCKARALAPAIYMQDNLPDAAETEGNTP